MRDEGRRKRHGMASIVSAPPVLHFGTPIALITTVQPDGSADPAPMSAVWALDDRVVLWLGEHGQCAANLRRHGECVIKLPDARRRPHIEAIAAPTGSTRMPASRPTPANPADAT